MLARASGLSWAFPSRSGMTSSSQRVHMETASLHSSSGFWPLTSWYTPASVANGSEHQTEPAFSIPFSQHVLHKRTSKQALF